MIRGRFAFDSQLHRYVVVGKRYQYVVPGTTDILVAGGFLVRTYYTAEGRDRGDSVHRALALVLSNLATSPPTGPNAGYVRSALQLCDDERHRLSFDLLEAAFLHRRLGFATHVDATGRYCGDPFVLNWKTGAPKRSDAVQSALEVLAVDGRITKRRRLVGYLKPTRGKLVEHANIGDFEDALEAIEQWRNVDHNPRLHVPLRLLSSATLASVR